MSRIFIAAILSTLFVTTITVAGSDPIMSRQALMEDTRDAAKVIGGMLKQEQAFDAEAAMEAFKVWKTTALEAGDLFPDGSETGHETEAKASIWTDRDGFNEKMADFSTAVDAAIAGQAANKVFPATPGNRTFRVLGRRSAGYPFSAIAGMACLNKLHKRSRRRTRRSPSSTRLRRAISQA